MLCVLNVQKKYLSASSWVSHFLENDRLFRTNRLTLALIAAMNPSIWQVYRLPIRCRWDGRPALLAVA